MLEETKIMAEVRAEHPETEEIFKLEELLDNAGYPYFFNLREELRPTPFGALTARDIDWDNYPFRIDIDGKSEESIKSGYAPMSVTFSTGSDGKLLEVLDMRGQTDPKNGKLTTDLTAEQCFEILKQYENLKCEPSTDAVSRAEAVKALSSNPSFIYTSDKGLAMAIVSGLPPVIPERPGGRWVRHAVTENLWLCSRCHRGGYEFGEKFNFCPNCGADMRG